MAYLFNLLLFIVTFAGGSIPLWLKGPDEKRTNYLLAFSGSFLLAITLLHLLPETFEELGHKAGLFLLTGFFIQLLIQRITHGIEHGHVHFGEHSHHEHIHTAEKSIPLLSILVGLSIHAFMEGLPLGFNYRAGATAPSLYLAVAAHKLPEAMLIVSLFQSANKRSSALIFLFFFSLITPAGALLAHTFGMKYYAISALLKILVPVVAGAFIHIATTIFFESGTRQHMLTWRKIIAIMLGVSLALGTLFFE